MMILEKLEGWKKAIIENVEVKQKSIDNCHVPGLFSLVIDGQEDGKLTRVFISREQIELGDVQYHDHRYGLCLTPLTKGVTHHLMSIDGSGSTVMPLFEYKSFLNGGGGTRYLYDVNIKSHQHDMMPGSFSRLTHGQVHTISCKKNSVWVVEETGFEKDHSHFLGVPFATEGLYTAPGQYMINDMCQLVLNKINGLIGDFRIYT